MAIVNSTHDSTHHKATPASDVLDQGRCASNLWVEVSVAHLLCALRCLDEHRATVALDALLDEGVTRAAFLARWGHLLRHDQEALFRSLT